MHTTQVHMTLLYTCAILHIYKQHRYKTMNTISQDTTVKKVSFKEDDVDAICFNQFGLCSVTWDDKGYPVLIKYYNSGITEYRYYIIKRYADNNRIAYTDVARTFFDKDNNFIKSILEKQC